MVYSTQQRQASKGLRHIPEDGQPDRAFPSFSSRDMLPALIFFQALRNG